MVMLKDLCRRRFSPVMDIQLAKVGVELLQRLLLRFGVEHIHQDGRKGVERHEDEVDARANVGHGNGPDLTYNDGAQRGARGRESKTFRPAIGWEDLRCVDPGAWPEAHAVWERKLSVE